MPSIRLIVAAPTAAAKDAFVQVSYQSLTLSRLLLVATCVVFLRGEPRTAVWLGLLLAGLLTHEQYLATLPMLLLLLAWRDGVSNVRARLSRPSSLRGFAATFAVQTMGSGTGPRIRCGAI